MSERPVFTISEIKKGVCHLTMKYDGIKSVMLIGSYAQNKAQSNSDIDLIIDLKNEFDSKSFFGFLDDAEQLFEKEVDLLTSEGVQNSVLKEELLRGGVYLYGEA